MPTINDAERAKIESKLVTSAVSKINGGLSPTKLEMDAVESAHARGKQANNPAPFSFSKTAITELGFEVTITETLESRGIYDLTRLEERKPEILRACIKMLGKGMGVDEIAECLGLDVRTIAAVRDKSEETGAMPGHKEMTARRLKSLVGMMISKYEAGIMDGSIKPGALDIAVILDKIALLVGDATSRVEVVVTDESDDFTRLLALERQARGRMVTTTEEISTNTGLACLASGEPRLTRDTFIP